MLKRTKIGVAVAVACLGAFATYVWAQHGPGSGQGHMGMGPNMMHGMGHGGMGRGMMGMRGGTATAGEMQELHEMLVDHAKIERTVTNLPNGITTLTESDDPEMTRLLVSHVAGMINRVEEGRNPGLPMQSPQLSIIFRNKDKIKTSFEPTPKGISVTQTSDDAETVTALQKHAADVTDLVRRGMEAAHETMMRNMGGGMGDHTMGHGRRR